ncbi:MAG: EAL domain-containing protein [Burkholderiaceae bacterium]|nr:EAL domain-containing protein [Burkholderiaceae bacterium]
MISVLTAATYTLAVAWVIRQQYLDQSTALLQNASRLILDKLSERQANLQNAERQLAQTRNLGETLWYLSQYTNADLDQQATLNNTYLQLARDTLQTSRTSRAGKVAIYDSTGQLVAFAVADGVRIRTGYVTRNPNPTLHLADLGPGAELNERQLRLEHGLPKLSLAYAGSLPQVEESHYAVVDGELALASSLPVVGKSFERDSSRTQTRQYGLVTMVQALDQDFADQMSRLTGTEINVFSGQALSHGSLSAYATPDGHGGTNDASSGGKTAELLNEIVVSDLGYYQVLLPIFNGNDKVGSIASLHSKALVQKNIGEMIRILLLIAGAILLLMLPLAWIFATSISRPLTQLSRILRKQATEDPIGDLGRELSTLRRAAPPYDELGDLTQSFVAMQSAVEQKIHQIHELNTSLERTVEERTAALVIKEREARTLIENTPDSISRYDLNCRRVYVNPAFASMSKGGVAGLMGKTPSENPGGADAVKYEERLREVLRTGKEGQFEMVWTGSDERQYCSHIRLTPEVDINGHTVSVLAIGRDITERITFEKTIWRQANFDSLTNLPNRQMFQAQLEHEAKVSRRVGAALALMLIDLDRFKEVNDSLGHDQGDILLIEAARRIASCVRNSDTVARIGGDEFTIILPQLHDPLDIGQTAENIIRKLNEPFVLGNDKVFVSASIGIAIYPNDATALDVLFKSADQAMYVAKSQGRSRFSFFTPDLQASAQRRLRMAADLRTALAEQQFELHYQPIVDLVSGQVQKAEALIRWHHPELGLLGPAEFIPLAEETGLIVAIGDWVFKQAVQQAAVWRRDFNEVFQISINTSPLQLKLENSGISSWPAYLEDCHLPGQCIAIEITEGLLLNTETRVNSQLLAFRDAGIQVSIDDFGTGYSSLSYLKKFHIDYLKIDRSFVHNLSSDADDLALCEAIIVMAHRLGLKVVAEGVETRFHRDLLATAQCDYAQGYFYTRPLPAHEFGAWLKQHVADA